MSDYIHFTTLTVWRRHFSFRLAFSHNLASRRGADTLLVALTDSEGRIGWGQVLPRDYLTGETLESAAADLRKRWWPLLREISLSPDAGHAETADALRPLFLEADAARLNASYAGVDVAAHALAAQRSAKAARGAAETVPLVGVVTAGSAKTAARLVRLLRWLGYRRFKVKVGTDAAGDAARLDAVRRAAGRDAWLAVDANAAWDVDEAMERMRAMARWDVRLVEEPLRRDAALTTDFRRLEAETRVAVMADESLCTLADGKRLLERGSPSWWNIRAAKNGGVGGAGALAALAREKGVRVYGGILVGETGALAAAGRELLFFCGAECGEYGFSRLFLRGDPFRGSPAGYRGRYVGPGNWGRLRLDGAALRAFGEPLFCLDR